MIYFKGISTLEELKKQWRVLAMQHHPDVGGNTETMQAINNEYDVLFPVFRNKHNRSAEVYNSETAATTRDEFYTQNGWKGKNYIIGQPTKEITSMIRKYCKEYFPDYKFSVTFSSYSGGSSISVSLMEAPHEAFTGPNREHAQVNHYYLDHCEYLTERTRAVLSDVIHQINSYRMDDSDSMIDYFHTNFYFNVNVGKWDKAFKIVEKAAKLNKSKARTNFSLANNQHN